MKTTAKKNTKAKVNREISAKIRAEAKALGLTHKEYLRLTLAISKALRETFGDTTGISPKALLTFVESPMFGILLQSLVQTAIKTVDTTQKPAAEANEGQQGNPPPSVQAPQRPMPQSPMSPNTIPHRQPVYPPQPMQPWGFPQPVMPGQPRGSNNTSPQTDGSQLQGIRFWP